MDKERLRKYLDNELTEAELKDFKSTEDYKFLQKLDAALPRMSNVELSKGEVFSKIKDAHIGKEAKVVKFPRNAWWAVAASFVAFILAGWYILFMAGTVKVDSSQAIAYLPDSTTVSVNGASTVTYDKDTYRKNRIVKLSGEAYFEVQKGSTFKVIGNSAVVTVLGTRFKVKDRPEHLEVICTEGKVQVDIEGQKQILTAGMSLEYYGKELSVQEVSRNKDIWAVGKSFFDNDPLKVVIAELERQYKITVETRNVDLKQRFTGAFTHDDLEQALQTIALPFQLNFKVEKDRVILSGERN
jgi:ferric-dicitrate binding protein FerR (iron transport regulator)